jgi:hypothetical protein
MNIQNCFSKKMPKGLLCAIIILFIILISGYIIYSMIGIKYKRIRGMDGRSYDVIYEIDTLGSKKIKLNDNQAAADMLSEVNHRIDKFKQQMINKFGNDHPISFAVQEYDPNVLGEHLPNIVDNDVAYTVNKGDAVRLCLRDTKNKYVIQDINTLMFVALHELTHISIPAIDHPPEFWKTFKFILTEASSINIYTPINYKVYPITYCNGMTVAYNPYYDSNLDISLFYL